MSQTLEPQHLSSLPVHPVPDLPNADSWELVVGDGRHSLRLDRAAMARLPHVEVVDDFTCLEGWTAGPLRWGGVRLSVLLDAIGSAGGPYLAVSAGDFCSVIALDSLPAETLLADSLDGRPLPREHGGPYRFVAPGSVCYQSVKWVQRIERCDSQAGDTARSIALARGDGALPH